MALLDVLDLAVEHFLHRFGLLAVDGHLHPLDEKGILDLGNHRLQRENPLFAGLVRVADQRLDGLAGALVLVEEGFFRDAEGAEHFRKGIMHQGGAESSADHDEQRGEVDEQGHAAAGHDRHDHKSECGDYAENR
jgi:hypothetical protein